MKCNFFFFFFFCWTQSFKLTNFFWLLWNFAAAHQLSVVWPSWSAEAPLHCRAWLLSVVASLVVECLLHTSGCAHFSSWGAQASLLCGMWDLPRPEMNPVSPALAGGFLTTAPPGKSLDSIFLKELNLVSEGKYSSGK